MTTRQDVKEDRKGGSSHPYSSLDQFPGPGELSGEEGEKTIVESLQFLQNNKSSKSHEPTTQVTRNVDRGRSPQDHLAIGG